MRPFWFIAGLGVPGLAWSAYATLGRFLANRLAERWGARLLKAGDGKFSDPAVFLHHRFFEAAWLVTLTVGLILTGFLAGRFLARRLPPLWRWCAYSVTSLAALNLWVKAAATTCLFWLPFWCGKGTTDNFTQFHIKLLLMDETRASTKIVLAGSSQVHAQIDHRLLNRQLGSNFFSMDLDFPGNYAYDFLLLERNLSGHQADLIVCYLSEGIFFNQGLSSGFPLFFSMRECPEFAKAGGCAQWGPRALGYGLLGDILPLFRLRDPVAQRLLGTRLKGLQQLQYESALPPDLHQRAKLAARTYHAGPQSRFEMAAFEDFVGRCRTHRRTVMLCCGQLNPVLESELEPGLRTQMLSYLRQLAARYDNVVLLEADQLPQQTAADYEDLTHVNRAAQIRYTKAIGEALERLASSKPAHSVPLE